ncbi:hypothetical protein GCM10010502_01130 [Kitasatospora aureofaciens]|uniref:Uncharacterized protein n=1 Tax=Kitasatospora aureofaciens TaxID=1894 RepID=A0A8H9HCS4_KITAU|nr:hypothetical protein GCM10010502_01130 [Kitasatospora aureofaciens]
MADLDTLLTHPPERAFEPVARRARELSGTAASPPSPRQRPYGAAVSGGGLSAGGGCQGAVKKRVTGVMVTSVPVRTEWFRGSLEASEARST